MNSEQYTFYRTYNFTNHNVGRFHLFSRIFARTEEILLMTCNLIYLQSNKNGTSFLYRDCAFLVSFSFTKFERAYLLLIYKLSFNYWEIMLREHLLQNLFLSWLLQLLLTLGKLKDVFNCYRIKELVNTSFNHPHCISVVNQTNVLFFTIPFFYITCFIIFRYSPFTPLLFFELIIFSRNSRIMWHRKSYTV